MRRSRDAGRLAAQLRRFYASGAGKKGSSGKPGPPVRPPGAAAQPSSLQQQPQPAPPKPASPPAAPKPNLAGPGLPNRPPISAATSGAAASPPPGGKGKSNQWLFSPAVPVDVRLLAAGTLALGGFITYAYFQKVNQAKNIQREQVTLDLGDGRPSDGDGSSGSSSGSGGSDAVPAAAAGQPLPNFYEEEVALGSSGAAAGVSSQAPEQAEQQEGSSAAEGSPAAEGRLEADVLPTEASSSDAAAVATLLNNVLSNQVNLAEAAVAAVSAASPDAEPAAAPAPETAPEAGAEPSGAAASDAALPAVTPAGEAGEQPGDSGAGGGSAAAESLAAAEHAAGEQLGRAAAAAREATAAAEARLQSTLEVVKEGIAGTAGEAFASTASSHAKKTRKEGEEAAAQPEAADQEQPPGQEQAAEGEASGLAAQLGISEALTPAALIKKAIERGEGSGDDWQEYRMRLAQAAADAKTFAAALQQAAAARQAQLAALEAEGRRKDDLVAELESSLREQAATFRQVQQREEAAADAQRAAELRRQAEYLATAFAEASLKERAVRGKALDEVRLQLNSLSEAFGRRSQQAAVSHGVHDLSLGVFALSSALESGAPCAAEARHLAEACGSDRLVAAAVASLPQAEQGLATRAQLLDAWPRLSQLATQLSYLPQGQGGLLQLWLAGLAARLKVAEPAPAGPPQTVDQALAAARAALVGGDLVGAARVLESGVAGTAAERVVAEWAASAKARVVAEQAVKLLQAHASAQEASVT